MKSKITLLATALMLSLYGCNSKTDRLLTSSNGEIVPDSAFTVSTTVDSSAFCPSLLKEIKTFISQNGDPVITVQIEEKGIERYIFLGTNLYYDSRFLCGYEIIEDRMVAYYYSYADGINDLYDFMAMLNTKESRDLLKESDCAELLIDKSKLEKGFPISYFDDPKGYADEKSSFAYFCYEPQGKRLLVHSADSLELVFEGYY